MIVNSLTAEAVFVNLRNSFPESSSIPFVVGILIETVEFKDRDKIDYSGFCYY